MGLDGVELIMELEDEFGVSLPDDKMTECRTPRELIEIIWSLLRGADVAGCPSQRAFYMLRRVVTETLKVPRRDIRPDTPVRSLVRGRNDIETWRRLRGAVGGFRWPRMRRPWWLRAMLLGAVLGLTYSVLKLPYVLPSDMHGVAACVAAMVVVPIVSALLLVVTRGWLRIPLYDSTLAALTPYVQSPKCFPRSRDEVAERVKRITMEQLGLGEEHYTEDSDFVKDFNMG